MAESADKDSKTEEATEKKIRDAVEKGQLPHSKEARDPRLLRGDPDLHRLLRQGQRDRTQRRSCRPSSRSRTPGRSTPESTSSTCSRDRLLASRQGASPAMLILLMVAGIGASVLQHAPSVVVDRIAPKLSRISIREGWKRLFGAQGFAEFLKSLGKLVFALGVPDVRRQRGAAPAAARHDHPARRLRPGDPRDRHRHPAGARPSRW